MKRKKHRKPKRARNHTLASKRAQQLKRAQGRKQRARFYRRRRAILIAKSRKKAVLYYRSLKNAGFKESHAAQEVAEKWQTSVSTIRRWEKADSEGGWRALMDKEKRPHTIHYRISFEVKLLVVVIRTLLGWGAHRISAELERREITQISHTSVNNIFHRYFLPTKTYHPKGKSDGVKHRRYRRRVANELWHLDFKGPIKLLNGRHVYLLIVIDDFSRFCLSVHICDSACAEAVKQALGQDFDRYGKPQEILTDNATAFTPVWQGSTGQLFAYLQSVGVEHKLISAYYPESNGKAEAFIKILSTECLQMKVSDLSEKGVRLKAGSACSLHDVQELSEFVNRFITYYNQYRAHGGVGYKPPVYWYAGICPQVKGLGGILGLEVVAQEWSGESMAAPPIWVNQELLARQKALVPIFRKEFSHVC